MLILLEKMERLGKVSFIQGSGGVQCTERRESAITAAASCDSRDLLTRNDSVDDGNVDIYHDPMDSREAVTDQWQWPMIIFVSVEQKDSVLDVLSHWAELCEDQELSHSKLPQSHTDTQERII